MDYIEFQNKKQLVMSELMKVPNARIGSQFTLIKCPYHSDVNPSCGVFYKDGSKTVGNFYCFSCKAKGTWNSLAETLGLQPFSTGKPKDEYTYGVTLDVQNKDNLQEKFMLESSVTLYKLPKNKAWRTISTNLLIDIGCKLCTLSYTKERFVYLPVIIDGETKGYTKGRLKKTEGKTSYINSRGSWVKKYGLFPFDYSIKLMKALNVSSMVLVEGQRDALRLLEYDIPALCIMGTKNWTENKKWLLETHGVKHIILMLDGDKAGIEATDAIKPTLNGFFDKVSTVKLWSMKGSPYLESPEDNTRKWDPGNCPRRIIYGVKKRIK